MSAVPSFWTIEEACRNAYPAREVTIDGWLLRAAGGRSRRTNSVNPVRGGPRDPAAIVTEAEAIYAGHGQRAAFRVPAFADGMDAALDACGYATAGRSLTLYADATALAAAAADDTLLGHLPDPPWFAAWAGLNPEATATDAAAFRASVGAVVLPARYALRRVDGRPAAIAFGVLHRELLVVEAVATGTVHRRQGHARAILAALLAWARSAGATGACLQVAADNAAALPLYRAAGFTRLLYPYHYRLAPAVG